jgi:hypothetical protein
MSENGDFHDAIPTQGGQPQPFRKGPVGFGKILGMVPFAFFNDQYLIPFFGESQSAYRTAEAAAYDDVIVLCVFHNLG